MTRQPAQTTHPLVLSQVVKGMPEYRLPNDCGPITIATVSGYAYKAAAGGLWDTGLYTHRGTKTAGAMRLIGKLLGETPVLCRSGTLAGVVDRYSVGAVAISDPDHSTGHLCPILGGVIFNVDPKMWEWELVAMVGR